MKLKKARRYLDWFNNSDFNITMWVGDRGDIRTFDWDLTMSRQEAPFFTGCISGKDDLIESPYNIDFSLTPGHTTMELPDLIPGKMTWRAAENNTRSLCVSPIKDGKLDLVPMNKLYCAYELSDQEFTLIRGHLLILIAGTIVTPLREVSAPHVINAKTQNVSLIMKPGVKIMEVWK